MGMAVKVLRLVRGGRLCSVYIYQLVVEFLKEAKNRKPFLIPRPPKHSVPGEIQ